MDNKVVENVRFVNTSGISTLGILGGVLVVLKCLGYINISWLWALAPFWIPFAIVSLILIGIVIVAFFASINNNKFLDSSDFTFTSTNEVDCNTGLKETILETTKETPKKKKPRKRVKKEVINEQTNTTAEGVTNK